MTDPTNVRAVDDISIMTSLDVRPAVASPDDVAAIMARISKLDTAVADAIEEGEELADETPTIDSQARSAADAPVVKLVNGIIAQAVEETGVGRPLRAAGPGDLASATGSTACCTTSRPSPAAWSPE